MALALVPTSRYLASERLQEAVAESLATSATVRPSAITAKTALYLCSATLISLMRGSVKHQPKPV